MYQRINPSKKGVVFNRTCPRTALDDLMDESKREQHDSVHSDESDGYASKIRKPSKEVVKKRHFTFSKKKPVYATLHVEEDEIPCAQPSKYTLHTSQKAGSSKGNMECQNNYLIWLDHLKLQAEDLCRRFICFKYNLSILGKRQTPLDYIDTYMYRSDSDLFSLDSDDDGKLKVIPPRFDRRKISRRSMLKSSCSAILEQDGENEGTTI